jgi:hypothetical protein
MTRDIQDSLQFIDIENKKSHTQTHVAHSAKIKKQPKAQNMQRNIQTQETPKQS